MAWRRESRYSRDSDWVFASDRAKGRTPRSAGVAGQDYLGGTTCATRWQLSSPTTKSAGNPARAAGRETCDDRRLHSPSQFIAAGRAGQVARGRQTEPSAKIKGGLMALGWDLGWEEGFWNSEKPAKLLRKIW